MTPVLHTLFEKFQAYENVHNEYVKAHQELSDAFVEAFKLQPFNVPLVVSFGCTM